MTLSWMRGGKIQKENGAGIGCKYSIKRCLGSWELVTLPLTVHQRKRKEPQEEPKCERYEEEHERGH